ncbi:MAG: hypothetical protein RMJ44_08680 [Cytophagales bacterium]|nr:hypothetical protein [Bernardetiaceae bacterium]MDW8211148.1 hypothetical protein [Cytophagales bacterium]
MRNLGFRLSLFFLIADLALFTMIVLPERGYQETSISVVTPNFSSEGEILPTAPAPFSKPRQRMAIDTVQLRD